MGADAFAGSGQRSISCAGSNAGGSGDDAVKGVERLLQERRRAEIAARIASGAFTVEDPGLVCLLLDFLARFSSPCCCLCVAGFSQKWVLLKVCGGGEAGSFQNRCSARCFGAIA